MQKCSFTDMMGREILVPAAPQRIISLVPSQTELLYDLGLGERVCGITKFCVHPEEWFRTKTRVGGTKNVNFEQVAKLQPDLIIANKEENTKEEIEALAQNYPVWVSDIKSINDALAMIQQVGALVNEQDKANILVQNITDGFTKLKKSLQPVRVAYFIWRDPWMCAGGDTFISNMIEAMGWENVLKKEPRYPSIALKDLILLQPQLILLSSEPYPFKDKHIAEIKEVMQTAEIRLVDGEMFSWYGSRLVQTSEYLCDLRSTFNLQ